MIVCTFVWEAYQSRVLAMVGTIYLFETKYKDEPMLTPRNMRSQDPIYMLCVTYIPYVLDG